MKELPTRPYLVRALFEWCADSGLTPYLMVRVNERTRVPMEHVKNGEIVLNISADATRNLTLGNDLVQFSARFNGVSREISIPIDAVTGLFAKETGQGMFFPAEEGLETAASEVAGVQPDGAAAARSGDETPPETPRGRPKLQVIK